MKAYPRQIPKSSLPGYETQKSLWERFASPEEADRPRIRWWVPSSYLSKEGIEFDIKSMKEAGFSGAEVVPMPRYDIPCHKTVDWGTDRWKQMSLFMLEMAEKYDFTIDFTMSPCWPLALPNIIDPSDPKQGAQVELNGAFLDGITRWNPYRGQVPVSREAVENAASVKTYPRLVAVTCAKYLEKERRILDYASARSLTLGEEVIPSPVSPLFWEVDFVPEDEGEYVLFGWWEHPSGERTCGNLQLDHYGKYGAEALIRYWEEELLPSYGSHFSKVVAMFIDSLEYRTHLDWTWDGLKEFQKQNGYDLAPFLPALYDSDNTFGNFVEYAHPDFQFDLHSQEIYRDYCEFMTRLYIENHLKPLTAFCEKHGIAMRYQTAYGEGLELLQTAMHVSIPETETLYGGDILDFYRIQSGAMHLSGRKIYSIEASAEMNGRSNGKLNSGNYQQTWKNQLWHLQRAMACCVNQAVFHGYSYEGRYDGEGNQNGFLPGVHWPGYTTMRYSEFSNNWGPTQPNWIHARLYTDFLARNQMVLREGSAKIDLAIYHHCYEETIDFNGAQKLYDDGGLLEQSGYSYDFIGPASFALDSVFVTDRQLAKEQAGYQALIFDHVGDLPAEAAKDLLSFAKDGLPLIFVGAYPTKPSFHLESEITSLIQELKALPNVRLVENRLEVKAALEEFGVFPRARYRERANLLTTCRHTEEGDYYYFYHYGNVDTFPQAEQMGRIDTEVTLRGEGVPYLFDAWSGKIVPILSYHTSSQKGERCVTVPLSLDRNDSCIIALLRNQEEIRHRKECSFCCEIGPHKTLLLKSRTGHPETVSLSDGTKQDVHFPALPPERRLSDWNLSLECWSDSPIPSESVKTLRQISHLPRLLPWKELPGCSAAAGIGTYETTFDLDSGWEEQIGYELQIGNVCDSFSLEINGISVAPNQCSRTIDIGPYLHKGQNRLKITVASTLLNALLDYAKRHPYYDEQGRPERRQPEAYGLLEDIFLVPYSYAVL